MVNKCKKKKKDTFLHFFLIYIYIMMLTMSSALAFCDEIRPGLKRWRWSEVNKTALLPSCEGDTGKLHAEQALLINHRIFTSSDLITDRRITGYIIHGPGIYTAELTCHLPLSFPYIHKHSVWVHLQVCTKSKRHAPKSDCFISEGNNITCSKILNTCRLI